MVEYIDKSTERYIISRYMDMTKLFNRLDIDWTLNGNMFCPFHENTRTRAAHLYLEDDKSYSLFCFSEHKMFTSYDVYKEFLRDVDTNQLALKTINMFPEEEQERILFDVGNERDLKELPFKEDLEKFRKRQIKYIDLLDSIVKKIEI